MQINVVNHPLLQAKMTILRDKDTKSVTFRHIISEVAALLTFETTRDLPVEEVKVYGGRTQCYSRSQCWSYRHEP